MRKSLNILVLTFGFSSFNAFAIQKECDGAKNCESVLGAKILIEINKDSLQVVSVPPGYEEGIGNYPFNKVEDTGNIQYSGADQEQPDGFTFSVDPELLKAGSKPITVTLDSGIEGKITADYTCHD